MTIEELQALITKPAEKTETKTPEIDYDKLAEALAKKITPSKKPDDEKDDESIIDKAKKDEADATTEKNKINSVAGAVKFLNGLDKVTTENQDMFGTTAKFVLSKLEDITSKDDVLTKANEYRKSMIDLWIEKQANLDLLSPEMKSEMLEYKSLSDSAKKDKSSQYWKIIDTGITIANANRKAELLRKGKSAGTTDDAERMRAFLSGKKKEDK